MQVIGTIVRLQVQESSLKVGSKPRRYDPAPIRSVPALRVSSAGVVGLTKNGETIVDVHHGEHPSSKNRGGQMESRSASRPITSRCDSGSVSTLQTGLPGRTS